MKKGDIVICSKPESFNFRVPQLVVGDKYQIVTDPFIFRIVDQLVFDVKNVETGRLHIWVESNHFIALDVLREFRLKEILEDGN
jgi:hypothetical protein